MPSLTFPLVIQVSTFYMSSFSSFGPSCSTNYSHSWYLAAGSFAAWWMWSGHVQKVSTCSALKAITFFKDSPFLCKPLPLSVNLFLLNTDASSTLGGFGKGPFTPLDSTGYPDCSVKGPSDCLTNKPT